MKKWLYLAGAIAAVGILSRLPHPARDITKLEPVRAVYLYREDGMLNLETDTGDSGSGQTLTESYADMKSRACGEIFLETAEFLLMVPGVPITAEFFDLFRPDCKVVFTDVPPDLKSATAYLAIHNPQMTLAKLRAR